MAGAINRGARGSAVLDAALRTRLENVSSTMSLITPGNDESGNKTWTQGDEWIPDPAIDGFLYKKLSGEDCPPITGDWELFFSENAVEDIWLSVSVSCE